MSPSAQVWLIIGVCSLITAGAFWGTRKPRPYLDAGELPARPRRPSLVRAAGRAAYRRSWQIRADLAKRDDEDETGLLAAQADLASAWADLLQALGEVLDPPRKWRK